MIDRGGGDGDYFRRDVASVSFSLDAFAAFFTRIRGTICERRREEEEEEEEEEGLLFVRRDLRVDNARPAAVIISLHGSFCSLASACP